MPATLSQTNFTAGEWSSLLDARVDLAKYQNSLYRMENFLIDPRGGAVLRPGTKFIAETKTSAKLSRLIRFEYSTTTAYMLEFGDLYIRVFKDQAPIETAPSTPYEIVSPYGEAKLDGINFFQSADVLYLRHPEFAPRKLTRTADDTWTLLTIDYQPPPLVEEGLSPDTTLTLSHTTGLNRTFTAGAGVFQTGDVGRIISSGDGRARIITFTSSSVVRCDIIYGFLSVGPIVSGDWSIIGSPQGRLVPSVYGPVGATCTLDSSSDDETRRDLISGGNNYWTISGSGTNEYYLINTAPFYSGIEPDHVYIDNVEVIEGLVGSLGIKQWDWGDNDALGYNTIYIRLSDGADPDSKTPDNFIERGDDSASVDLFRSSDVGKYIKIRDGIVKITTYSGAPSVIGKVIKVLSSTAASFDWTLESSVWSSTNGYPSCGCFFEERMVEAGSPAYPETLWGSYVGDYENFTSGTTDSHSFSYTLSGRRVNAIQWLEPKDFLMAGTNGGEWRLGPEDTGQALTPLNILAKEKTTFGCSSIPPESIAGSTLFVQKSNRKIREFTFNWESDGYVAPDLTQLAEHITESGIKQIAYQQEPNSILWAITNDGVLIGMTYQRDQDVVGWHVHPMGSAEVESIACIPGDGYDELWMIVKRTVNGGTVRYVEVMAELFSDSAATYTSNKGANAFFVDCGITYSGVATTTISGLDHLEGETVAVLADGNVETQKVVASGAITLDASATKANVGLPYTAILQQQRLEIPMADGTAQGRLKKLQNILIRVYNSGPFKVGRDENNLDVVIDRERSVTLGEPYDLFSGDLRVGLEGRWEPDARLMIVQDKPMPLTILGIMPQLDISKGR